jgi:hypothetical protein
MRRRYIMSKPRCIIAKPLDTTPRKTIAQAAHQALIAHGHTQQAIRHGNEATKFGPQ